MGDRGDQRVAVGRVARARGLKAPEVGVREPDVRQRVLGIERERALEVRHRRRHLRRVERLELEPALGERTVGVEAGGLARADAFARGRGTPICSPDDSSITNRSCR